MNRPEEKLQLATAVYLRLQYPKVLAVHHANERKAKPQFMRKLKQLGSVPGCPDWMIYRIKFKEGKRSAGLAIELKVHYRNDKGVMIKTYPSDEQKEMLEKLKEQDWECHIVYDFENFKEIVDKYLRQ